MRKRSVVSTPDWIIFDPVFILMLASLAFGTYTMYITNAANEEKLKQIKQESVDVVHEITESAYTDR